jgi:hypothetical protein
MSLFGAIRIDGAVTTIWHLEGFKISFIVAAECVGILKAFTHATFPASRKLYPVITYGRALFA